MTGRELLRLLQRRYNCIILRQNGSHVRVRCAECFTTVPNHAGEDLGVGLIRAIERDLEPCLGERWVRN